MPKTYSFTHLERRFRFAPLTIGVKFHPAVTRTDTDGYRVRILKSATVMGDGRIRETFDYFEFDAAGVITAAPHGYAKDYKPGRCTVEALSDAVTRYTGVPQ